MLEQILTNPEFWKYLSIPVVAAVVGWFTNWVAIKLTFYPLRFRGLRPFLGWQGIIPSKAGKMASTFANTTMSRLGELSEVFDSMEPEKISEQIRKVMVPRMADLTDQVMMQRNPTLWRALPGLAKDLVYTRVRTELPSLIDNLMADIGQQVEDLIDFEHMLVTRLVRDKALLNRLFLECGAKEFKFLVNSGFWFGGLFGLVQLGVWLLHQAWWVLPLFGFLVGWATNWIAINLIFRPLHPVKVGPFRLQGLFLKRQREVAGIWCGIVTREILTIRSLVDAMLFGPRADGTHRLVRRHIAPLVDETVSSLKLPAQAALGQEDYRRLQAAVGDKAVEVSVDPFDDWIFNRERSQVVEMLLRERMEALPSEDFQDLLRPCFQEEELKLILVGAGLGLAAGIAQLVFVFGGV